MSWLLTFAIVQIVFRSIAWVITQLCRLIGYAIPDAAVSYLGAAWRVFEGALWDPWTWAALLPLALFGDGMIVLRRRAVRRRANPQKTQ
jgi:hypothetical protein